MPVSPDTSYNLAQIAAARTFLFVPGDRPERFDKAHASGADIVIIDLEDAVAPPDKESARQAVAGWLSADKPVVVRINGASTSWFEDDLALCRAKGVLGVMLPKAEAGPVLDRVAASIPTIALIESARGMDSLSGVAATPGVARLAFGTIDLALDLDTDSEALIQIMGVQLIVASRAHGLSAPIDGVTRTFKEADIVEAAMRDAKSRGFGAKLCIHPAQVAPVRDALRPTEGELEAARKIVMANEQSGGQAVALDGQMIDRPIVERAYNLLRRAD